MDVDDRFNILVDANIELCERVVSNLISVCNFLIYHLFFTIYCFLFTVYY